MKEIVFGIMSFEYVCKGTRRRENRIKERTRSPLLYENDLECFCITVPITKKTFLDFVWLFHIVCFENETRIIFCLVGIYPIL